MLYILTTYFFYGEGIDKIFQIKPNLIICKLMKYSGFLSRSIIIPITKVEFKKIKFHSISCIFIPVLK